MLKATQSTLFLLVVIALVIAPHLPQLPWWCIGFTVTVLLWRGWIAYQGWALPKRWVLVLALLGCMIGVYASHKTLVGQAPGTTLVVALLALKTMELRAQRDAFVVFFLGFFVMMANLLESQSLATALAMVVGMAGLLAGLVNAQLVHEAAGIRVATGHALKILLWGTPLMALLFVLFPRVAPLWGLPEHTSSARTGLSEDMTVGRIAQLAKDDKIAMRVKFDGVPPKVSDLYFRGPILSHFDGQTWRISRANHDVTAMPEAFVQSKPVRYEVTLEPHERDWLMTLDLTPQGPDLAGQVLLVSQNFQWYGQEPISKVVRYKAVSYTQYQYGLELSALQLNESVYLPPQSNPRLQALAAQKLADPVFRASSVASKVDWVMQQLATGGYRYTLEPGVYGRHAADEFWFDRKEGFCEHIASSFVVMMRALGVPARVVTGYQGGELNPVDGFWLVRQSDAHAWVEVWMAQGSAEGQGWVRVDPTAAVVPARVLGSARLEPQRGAVAGAVGQFLGVQGVNWLRKARDLWDASENLWTQNVLNFSRDRQFEFLKKLGFDAPSDEALGRTLAALFAAGLLLFAVLGKVNPWRWWHWRPQDPWVALWVKVKQDALDHGFKVDASTTPRQLADLVRQAQNLDARPIGTGSQQEQKVLALTRWLIQLENLRYAPSQQAQSQKAEMNNALNGLKKQWKSLGFGS